MGGRERRRSQGGGLSKPVARRSIMEQCGVQQRKTAATTNTVTLAALVSSLSKRMNSCFEVGDCAGSGPWFKIVTCTAVMQTRVRVWTWWTLEGLTVWTPAGLLLPSPMATWPSWLSSASGWWGVGQGLSAVRTPNRRSCDESSTLSFDVFVQSCPGRR